MQKKVCFFIGTVSLGGIGKLSVYLMDEFVKKGISVDLFLMKGGGEYLSQVPKEVNVFVKEGASIRRIFKFVRYLYKERPTVSISSRQRQDIVNIFCCLLTFGKTTPVVSIHTNVSAENKYNTNTQNTKNYVAVLSKILYKIPKKIIAVSKGVAEDFSRRTGVERNNIEVIYNPVYKPNDKTDIYPLHPIVKGLINDKKDYIISVGRLTHAKDFSTLIRAFAMVREKRDISLVILGDGPLYDNLESEIANLGLTECVNLLGFVPNPTDYIANASLFVMSSKWEGFGIVIVEALACGIPVVSTDCPSGPSEILENGKYGTLVPVEDPNAMANAILNKLNESHDSTLLINRAYDFAPRKIASEYLQYIGI